MYAFLKAVGDPFVKEKELHPHFDLPSIGHSFGDAL
jgi:hypothetical protein